MLVLMAIFSTVVTTPALRRWLPRLGTPPAASIAGPTFTAINHRPLLLRAKP